MKRKKAAALKYDNNYPAPVVTALGFGKIAETIQKKAKENNIPIIKNSALVESLTNIPLGDNIPPELYQCVAEIIAFVYSLNDEKTG